MTRWSWAVLRRWHGRWTCTEATWPSATQKSSSSTLSRGWWKWPPAWPSVSGGGCHTLCPMCTRRCCRLVTHNEWRALFFSFCSENILPWFFFTIGEQKSSYFDRRWRRGLSQRWSSCVVEQLLITPSIFLYYVKFRWIVENIQKNLTKSFIPPVEIVTDWGEDKGREEEEKLKKAGGWAE